MTRIAALILLAAVTAAAADVAGKWNVIAKTPSGAEHKAVLELKEEGGKVTGSMASAETTLPIENVKLEGDRLSYTLAADGEYKIAFTVARDEMKGTYTTPDGATGPMVARRAGAASGVAGSWQGQAKSEDGREYKFQLELAVEGSNVTGALSVPDGSVPLSGGRLDGNSLTFKLVLDEGAYDVKLAVAGSDMTGTYTGPGGEKGKITARR